MEQSKTESLIESLVNQFTGIVTAFLVWRFIIIPLYGIPDPGFLQNVSITLVFTFVSVLRSYLWRRFFNGGLHKIVHRFIVNFYNGVKK